MSILKIIKIYSAIILLFILNLNLLAEDNHHSRQLAFARQTLPAEEQKVDKKKNISFEAGFLCGPMVVSDKEIKDVYGNGIVYYPYACLDFWKGLLLGLGYEFGYSRAGKIGLFQEDSTLKMSGLEFFLAYQFKMKRFSPYVKLGYGLYSYCQSIQSIPLGNPTTDEKKSAFVLGGGIKYYPWQKFFINLDIKYVPLTVKPFEEKVNLDGIRCSGGIGYSF